MAASQAAGVEPPEGMCARGLLDVLESPQSGQVDTERTFVVTGRERHVAAARPGNLPYPQRAIHTKDFLYIRNFAPNRWPMGDPEGLDDSAKEAPSFDELCNNTMVAYRDLDAKVRARNAALETWRRIYALHEAGRRGGEAAREAQSRGQVFRFEEEVQDALVGSLLDRTNTFNGSPSGTFVGLPGVHVAERRLRLLMGLPTNGPRLIRPSDEPSNAPIVFDWARARMYTP